MVTRIPAETFPPGEFLREEMDARNWNQQELADILDRPPRLISELVTGKRAVTPETARGLADAFGTTAEYWMNLESQYQLSKVKASNDHVSRKARLYDVFPVREMLRRGWVRQSENIDVLEQRFCEFFDIPNLATRPTLSHRAKRTNVNADVTPIQLAWMFRVRAMAAQQRVAVYSEKKLLAAIDQMKTMLLAPEETRHVPRLLGEAGVRLAFVEPERTLCCGIKPENQRAESSLNPSTMKVSGLLSTNSGDPLSGSSHSIPECGHGLHQFRVYDCLNVAVSNPVPT